MAAPARPETTSEVITGESSITIAKETTVPTKSGSLKKCLDDAPDWSASTMPVKKAVIALTGKDSTPMRCIWITVWRHSIFDFVIQVNVERTMNANWPAVSTRSKSRRPSRPNASSKNVMADKPAARARKWRT